MMELVRSGRCRGSPPEIVLVFLLLLVVGIALFVIMSGETENNFDDEEGVKNDLTMVTWAHAVNSKAKLEDVLANDKINMIEADVNQGTVTGATEIEPIMAHPPDTQSDLSLRGFVERILQVPPKQQKGVKFDFKHLDVVAISLQVLLEKSPLLTFPVWFNADIVPGPGLNPAKVDADEFLRLCQSTFPGRVLSLGWTTTSATANGSMKYDQAQHIDPMISGLKQHGITQELTFAVRASLVQNSLAEMSSLLDSSAQFGTHLSTLTIWSHASDHVDFDKMAVVIKTIGRHRVYLDVPVEQEREIQRRLAVAGY